MVDLLEMRPLLSIGVALDLARLETIPQLQQLNHDFSCFFEHNESINAPSIKSESVVPVENELCQELEYTLHNLIILVECIESPLNDWTEELRVEPIKEKLESAIGDKSPDYAFEDVEQFHYLGAATWH